MIIYGPYMFIYGPYMVIHGPYMIIYGPYMIIYGPCMITIQHYITLYNTICADQNLIRSKLRSQLEFFLVLLLLALSASLGSLGIGCRKRRPVPRDA